MRDSLYDIVKHTLPFMNRVKIIGNEENTEIHGYDDARTIVVKGHLFKQLPEFQGTFGMPDLNKLKTILDISEYKNVKIHVDTQKQNDNIVPVGIRFQNEDKTFSNSYRFMSTSVINEQLKDVMMKDNIKWDVEFSPSLNSIKRFKMQSAVHNDEINFRTDTQDGNLVFHFGSVSTHEGSLVFQEKVGGNLNNSLNWPINYISKILDFHGDMLYRISDAGATEIIVDSGIGEYHYQLPAITQ